MTSPGEKPLRKHLSEKDLEVLVRTFIKSSRVDLLVVSPATTTQITRGLRAVFLAIGLPVDKRLEGRSLTREGKGRR